MHLYLTLSLFFFFFIKPAIKQAQAVFLSHQETTAREKELIKGVPDMEAINTMMSKVKVSAPNLLATKSKKGGRR